MDWVASFIPVMGTRAFGTKARPSFKGSISSSAGKTLTNYSGLLAQSYLDRELTCAFSSPFVLLRGLSRQRCSTGGGDTNTGTATPVVFGQGPPKPDYYEVRALETEVSFRKNGEQPILRHYRREPDPPSGLAPASGWALPLPADPVPFAQVVPVGVRVLPSGRWSRR